jgi:TonB family protein
MKKGMILVACLLAVLNDASAATEADGDLSMTTHQAIFSGTSQTIWYLYSLHPDCISGGLPSVEVIKTPSHGSIQVGNVESFPAYPSTNQRYECNKRKSPMVSAVYTPEKTFVGSDKFVLRGTFASGNSMAKEYVVTIEASQPNTLQQAPVALSDPNGTRLISVVTLTPPRIDPANPLKIGGRYYPPESLRAKEQGRCIVSVTVGADGWLKDASLQQSTGYPRLDKACLDAVAGGHLFPATEDGMPIEKAITLPMNWFLTH